jgi:hypothetical protein
MGGVMRLGRKLAEGFAVDREAEQADQPRVPEEKVTVPVEVTVLEEAPEPVRPARV